MQALAQYMCPRHLPITLKKTTLTLKFSREKANGWWKKKKKKPGGDEQVGWGLHASFSTRPRTLETTARTQRSRELVLGVRRVSTEPPTPLTNALHTSGPAGTDRGATTHGDSQHQKCCTPLPPFPTTLPEQPWLCRNSHRFYRLTSYHPHLQLAPDPQPFVIRRNWGSHYLTLLARSYINAMLASLLPIEISRHLAAGCLRLKI